jgi:hypothetical protein
MTKTFRKELRIIKTRKRLMQQIAAVAKRKGLPCPITPEEVRKEKISG